MMAKKSKPIRREFVLMNKNASFPVSGSIQEPANKP